VVQTPDLRYRTKTTTNTEYQLQYIQKQETQAVITLGNPLQLTVLFTFAGYNFQYIEVIYTYPMILSHKNYI